MPEAAQPLSGIQDFVYRSLDPGYLLAVSGMMAFRLSIHD